LKTTYISPSVEKLRDIRLEELQQLSLEQQIAPASFQAGKECLFWKEQSKVAADPAYNISRTLSLNSIVRTVLHIGRKNNITAWFVMKKEHQYPFLGEGRKTSPSASVRRKKLRESEERFRSLYENSTIGLYRTSPDGKIILGNPTLVKMLGYSSFEELAARNLEQDGFEPSYERKNFY